MGNLERQKRNNKNTLRKTLVVLFFSIISCQANAWMDLYLYLPTKNGEKPILVTCNSNYHSACSDPGTSERHDRIPYNPLNGDNYSEYHLNIDGSIVDVRMQDMKRACSTGGGWSRGWSWKVTLATPWDREPKSSYEVCTWNALGVEFAYISVNRVPREKTFISRWQPNKKSGGSDVYSIIVGGYFGDSDNSRPRIGFLYDPANKAVVADKDFRVPLVYVPATQNLDGAVIDNRRFITDSEGTKVIYPWEISNSHSVVREDNFPPRCIVEACMLVEEDPEFIKSRVKRDITDTVLWLLSWGTYIPNHPVMVRPQYPQLRTMVANINHYLPAVNSRMPEEELGALIPSRGSVKLTRAQILGALDKETKINIDIGGVGPIDYGMRESLGFSSGFADAININERFFDYKAKQIPNLVIASGEKLPFDKDTIDTISMQNGPTSADVMDEIVRVVKSPGVIYIDFTTADMHDRISEEEVEFLTPEEAAESIDLRCRYLKMALKEKGKTASKVKVTPIPGLAVCKILVADRQDL